MARYLQPDGSRRTLWRFHGGLHMPDHKALSNGAPITPAGLPPRLILPLQQHIGAPSQCLARVGDRVLKGQLLARAQGYVSAALHAPTSGTLTAIEDLPVPHPSGLSAPCLVLVPDGEERWAELPEPLPDYLLRDPGELRDRVRWAGIVGMGGAAFPSSVKLNPGPANPIHTLVINGAECEPYITCDDRLMRERPGRVLAGIRILMHILGARRCLVGIEDNKPEAIESLYQHRRAPEFQAVEIVRIPTLYPSGGEKQLIRVLTGQEVPSGGLPAQLGMVCHNLATAAAVADAVLEGRPLIQRVVTLTGQGLARPCNLEALIGTPVSHLIALAGGYTERVNRLLLGGPMMGFALASDAVPITKAGNCVLALTPAEAPDPGPALPCIRCGACARVCPVNLLPQQLYWHARARELDKVQDYHLFDCIECGCCAQVCPSHIPLVQYYRHAKTESWAREREQRAAEQAKRRFAARAARLERQEAERLAKLRKSRETLEPPPAATTAANPVEDPRRAAIEAARQRAEAKKQALATQGIHPANMDQLTPAQQRQKDAADARRRQAAQGAPAASRPDPAPAHED